MNTLFISGLALSLILNFVLIWYSIRLLRKLYYISQNADFLLSINTSFTDHLSSLYELEMYYGEPTLENLLKHARYTIEEVENFNNIFSGVDVFVEDATGDEIEEEEEEEEEDIDGEAIE